MMFQRLIDTLLALSADTADRMALSSQPRRHKDWPEKSKEFLKGKVCAACGGKTMLTAHHCLPFHLYPELEMDERYWVPLCEHPGRNCHLNIGHAGSWKAFNPFVLQDAELLRQRRLNRSYNRL